MRPQRALGQTPGASLLIPESQLPWGLIPAFSSLCTGERAGGGPVDRAKNTPRLRHGAVWPGSQCRLWPHGLSSEPGLPI